MRPNLSTADLARASAQHPWRTVGIWLTILGAAAVLIGTLLGDALSDDVAGTLTNNPESRQADQLLDDRLGASDSTIGEMAIIRSTTLTVDDPAYREHVEQLYGELMALGSDVIAGGTHYYLSGDASLVSPDRRTTLMPLEIPDGARERVDLIHGVAESASEDGAFQILVSGEATLNAEIADVAERDLQTGEGIGVSVALVVLALVFGAIAAAVLPIVLAVVAIVTALGVTALVAQVIHLPFLVINMMTMLGLAVGIDYSLFVVSRYREERARKLPIIDAITTSGATAGRTVLISGMTVALALMGLLITPDSANRALGIGALLIVAAAVLGSLTLLPALLRLMGDKVNALRIPLVRHRPMGRPVAADSGFWSWTTRTVTRRPVISLVLATGLLLGAASQYVDIEQGEVGISSLPDELMAKEAFVVLQEEFGFGQDLPVMIVIDGQTNAAPVEAAIERLEAAIASDPAFAISELEVHPNANLAILRVWLAGDPMSVQSMDAVERLRADYIQNAFNGVPATALVTGESARLVDLTDVTDTYTPIVFAFVLSLSFVLLTVAFRSIVIPLKAILLNLLSVGAAYGLLVLVFQKGVGADLLGFKQVDVIQTGLPLFLFAVLFGLSMDYHVFLLSRVRERFLQTGDNSEAVTYGLRSTSRLITGAALIMVAVFGGFALGDLVAMQQFGFGLAVAVLIDATIVRSVLVPASMRLLGRWNWYLPNVLRWLPDLRVEGPGPAETPAAAD